MLHELKKLGTSLENVPDIVASWMPRIPEERLYVRRNETAWTLREHLAHLVEVQPVMTHRIITIRDNERPVITPFDPLDNEPESRGTQSAQELLDVWKTERRKQLSLLETLTESDMLKKASHPEYTDYDMGILLNHMLFHEYWHLYRMEEIWLQRDEFFN